MNAQLCEMINQGPAVTELRLQTHPECRDLENEAVCGVLATKEYFPVSYDLNIPFSEYLIFFASAREAEAAGYKSNVTIKVEKGVLAVERQQLALELCRYIERARHIPTLEELSREAALSPSYLHHFFRKFIGVTPRGFANAVRVRRVWQALVRGDKLADIIEKSGYASASRFYLESRYYLGMPPSSFRKGGAGAQLSFAVVNSVLGEILLAWTGRGFSALLFDDAREMLVGRLHRLFPQATLRHADAKQREIIAELAREAGEQETLPDLPLNIRRNVFLQRVLQLLKKQATTIASLKKTDARGKNKTRRLPPSGRS